MITKRDGGFQSRWNFIEIFHYDGVIWKRKGWLGDVGGLSIFGVGMAIFVPVLCDLQFVGAGSGEHVIVAVMLLFGLCIDGEGGGGGRRWWRVVDLRQYRRFR